MEITDRPWRLLLTRITGEDAVDLTPELALRLIADGWDAKMIEEGTRDGARYSPRRNSLLYPQMFGSSDDDEDDPQVVFAVTCAGQRWINRVCRQDAVALYDGKPVG